MQSAPKSSVEDAPVMNALKGINDLTNEIRRFGVFFIVFSFVFYISVPLLYYYAGVHWSLVDSIFVSLRLFCFTIAVSGQTYYSEFSRLRIPILSII